MRGRPVAAFLGVTGLLLVLAVAGALAAPQEQTRAGPIAIDAEVPDPGSFEAPTAAGVATVDDETYDSVQAAVDAADPGDTVRLSGRFDEHVTVGTANVTITASGPGSAMLDGNGEGDVLTVDADDVTVQRIWVRNSGWDADTEDAGVFVNGSDVTVRSARLTAVTFGVWVDGVDDVTVENTTIVGREDVRSHAERGNGIQLWETENSVVRGNDVTRVRDGIYFSWTSDVVAADNRLWDLRYGVHYMYSDGNVLVNNTAWDNDVGYALMVSEDLRIANNTAIGNRGQSGYGVMIKDIEDTTVSGNVLADNEKGMFVSNSLGNRLVSNLVLENDVGVQATAGTSEQTVAGNSFVYNDVQAFTTRDAVIAWNGSDRGNYWSDARTVDRSNDGVSETRHRPAGTVERLVHERPEAAVFAESPAFSVVRLAENSFPVIQSPGIVDHRPLTEAPHDDWERYYAERRNQHANRSN